MKYKITQHLKRHIIRNHFLHIGLGVAFGIAMIIRLFSSSAQVSDPFFPFNSFIGKHTNTSTLYFQYGGNSFTGVIAWSGRVELASPELITLSGSSSTGVLCHKRIEGLYYNPIRGAKLWPLDANTLQNLKGLDGSYQGMLIHGGLYTDCIGSGVRENYVLGQVAIHHGGSRYDILAGLKYDEINNVLSLEQTMYSGTLLFKNNRFQGRLFDVYGGGIADVSNQTLPSHMAFGGFTGAVFFPGINNVVNADLRQLYQSNNFSIVGLQERTLVSISSGALLYINGSLVGTSAIVQNGEEIKIEMFASENYAETVSSTITVGDNLTGTFSITTKSRLPDRCLLTREEKQKVENVFSGLLIQYNSTSKLTALLTTMKSMINDMQDFNYDCNAAYLQTLIEDYLEEIKASTNNIHIAPNCRKYTIIYSNTGDKVGYTSSNLRIRQYFASRQSLIMFIDSKNPGDCNVVDYSNLDDDYIDLGDNKYIAPNGKVYEIRTVSNGKYASPNMLSNKEFSSRETLIDFIDKNNPPFEVRDHTVDTSRPPVTYTAANNKEYKIYKTDKGFMSYKLVKVQYFPSKEAIIAYINKYNKR